MRSEKGFSLLEVVVTVGIGAILSVGLASFLSWTAQMQGQAMELIALQSFKQQMLKSLASDEAWQNTLQMGALAGSTSRLSCLTDMTPCTTNGAPGGPPITNQPFALYDAANNLIFDATVASNGLTPKGLPCGAASSPPGFSNVPGGGNAVCPFRYDLTWSAVCRIGNCVNPQVVVNAVLRFSPGAVNNLGSNIDRAERYSIINYFANPSACFAKSQVYALPGNYSFTVPNNYRRMIVELWGGGGGGAAAYNDWAGCYAPSAGNPGGFSRFGGLVANGGPGGRAEMVVGGSHTWFFCVMGFCGIIPLGGCDGTAASLIGGTGYPQTAVPGPQIPADQQMCSAKVTAMPGLGGQGYNGGTLAGFNGSVAGGGGAGSGPFTAMRPFFGGSWLVITWTTLQGAMGAYDPARPQWNYPSNPAPPSGSLQRQDTPYATAAYSPATLAPGSIVPVTVGAGGAGGVAGGRSGGRGAGGLVRIVYW